MSERSEKNVGLTDLLDGWRLVDEELPPDETPVWLWDGTHCFIGEHFYDGDWWLFAKCFHMPWWDQNYGWRADDLEADDYKPTHWRPLPQPPNENPERLYGPAAAAADGHAKKKQAGALLARLIQKLREVPEW